MAEATDAGCLVNRTAMSNNATSGKETSGTAMNTARAGRSPRSTSKKSGTGRRALCNNLHLLSTKNYIRDRASTVDPAAGEIRLRFLRRLLETRGISHRETIVGRLFESGENADVGVIMALAFGPRAVFAEEGLDTLGEVGGLLTVDVDDECRVFAVAVVDDERELVELVGVTIVAEVLGNEVCEIGE